MRFWLGLQIAQLGVLLIGLGERVAGRRRLAEFYPEHECEAVAA
jgi:hypothetical protein